MRKVQRKRYGLTFLCLPLLILTTLVAVGHAQSNTQAEIVVRISVPPVLYIAALPSEVTFTADQVVAGRQENGGFIVEKGQAITLIITGNVPHSLWVSTETASWTGANGTIPVSRLHWRVVDRDWMPLSTEMRLVRETAASIRDTISLDLRLSLEMTDPPGAYAGDIVFTLQAREG